MTVSLVLIIVLPLTLVTWNIADSVTHFYRGARQALDAGGFEPPAWLRQLPLVGEVIDSYLRQIMSSKEELRSEERRVGKECRSRWSPYH